LVYAMKWRSSAGSSGARVTACSRPGVSSGEKPWSERACRINMLPRDARKPRDGCPSTFCATKGKCPAS